MKDRFHSGLIVCAAFAVLASAAPALAAEAAHGEKPSLFAGDFGAAIWTLVIFLVVLFVLGKFAWGPILATLQRREQFIRESLEEAKQDREKAEKDRAALEERLRKAHDEAASLIDQGRREAEQTRKRLHAQAREEADGIINRATGEIEQAKDTAVKELYDHVANMAADIASNVLRKQISEEDHRRLLDASLEEIRTRTNDGNVN